MRRTHHQLTALLLSAALACTSAAAFADEADNDPTLGASETIGESETLGISDAPELAEAANVLLPKEFTFTIDPFEKEGRGQVYSEPIRVVNQNPFPVTIGLSDLAVTLGDSDVMVREVPVRQPLFQTLPDKEIHLALASRDEFAFEGEIPITERGLREPVAFTLGASSEAVFQITGSVNPSPLSPWREGDVRVVIAFTVGDVPPEKEELAFDDE